MKKQPLIVLTGPTAVGKTKLSISLAKALGAEIISADSMQVYKGMDIGSAKIRPEQMEGVPHHLVDILEPTEDFHIVLFQKLAQKAMEEIYARGRIPMLVGGTGFYIQAVTRGIDFTKAEQESAERARLEALAKEQGHMALFEMLKSVDPKSAELIHPNNLRRVIRALEFYQQNGFPISQHNETEREKDSPYNLAYFVLTAPRERLYGRIDRRVDEMMAEGLLEETKRLYASGCRRGMTSMQGLGYKELLDHLEGKCSLSEAVEVIKRDTRHFAKRQITWFKREPDVYWLPKQDFDYDDARIAAFLLKELEQKGISGEIDTKMRR